MTVDSLSAIDQVELRFDATGLLLLQIILALVMFGIALDLRPADFARVLRSPKAPLVGLAAQWVLLPALTWALIALLRPDASLALGMMLVAACPGGNISNFFTHLARGSTALSVSMSAVSTLGAIVMTPLNFGFWASRYGPTAELLRRVALDPVDLLFTVALLLGLPILVGMTVAGQKPLWAERLRKPMRWLSLVFFALFVVAAMAANFDLFLQHAHLIVGWVLLHNALALILGWTTARVAGLTPGERRAITIEVGIQNSGLGLVLIFGFFGGLGGMALITAWWGVWHLISGWTVATLFSRQVLPVAPGGVDEVKQPA